MLGGTGRSISIEAYSSKDAASISVDGTKVCIRPVKFLILKIE